MTAARAPVAALLAAVAVACGGGSASHPAAPPSLSGSPSPDPGTPGSPPPGASPRPLATVAGTPAPHTRAASIPWRLVRVSDADRRVYVVFTTGGCTIFDHVDVQESAAAVELAVWAWVSTGNVPCPAFARIEYGWVTLRAPLGRRTLLHTPVTGG